MKSSLTTSAKTKVLEQTSSEKDPVEIGLIAAEIVTMEFIPILSPEGDEEGNVGWQEEEPYKTIGECVDEYLEIKKGQDDEVRCLTIHLKTAEDKAAMRERPYEK